jgi:hypothetical protein
MFLRNSGLLFIVLVAVETVLGIAYGYHAPYGDARVDRATHEYLERPTPENKAAMDAERERVYAPGRKRNRVVMALLIANSCLTAAVGYGLLKKRK